MRAVDLDLVEMRNVARHQRHDQIQRPEREQTSASDAEGIEHEVLGQRLPDDAAAGRAECQPDGELLAATADALELQVRNVRAGYQQDEADRAEEGVERGAEIVERLLVERHQRQRSADLVFQPGIRSIPADAVA